MNEVLEVLLRRHRPDNEALSALLDGQLAGRRLDAVQAHVASCAACRERLAALRRTRHALRAMPAVDAPRSFRVRAADAAAPAPVRRAPVAMRAMPVLGAVAALVFIVVLEADLARGGSSTSNEATGLQALSAGTRHAATAPAAGVSQIGGADAAPTSVARSSSNPAKTPATAYDSSSGGVGAPPARESATPPASAGSPLEPQEGSPQPALGLAPGPATPPGEQSAPNAPAPAAPPTHAPDSGFVATITLGQGGPAEANAPTAADSSSAKSASSQSSGGSSDRSDVTYRIVEAVAAAIALAAIAGSVAWRIRNRKVGP